jgi:hypothetical protein
VVSGQFSRLPKKVFDKVKRVSVGGMGISAITYSELQFGVSNSNDPERHLKTDSKKKRFALLGYDPRVGWPPWQRPEWPILQTWISPLNRERGEEIIGRPPFPGSQLL